MTRRRIQSLAARDAVKQREVLRLRLKDPKDGKNYFTRVEVRSIVSSVYVCRYASVSVCLLAHLKIHVPTSRNYLYMLTVAVVRFSTEQNAICHVGLLPFCQ